MEEEAPELKMKLIKIDHQRDVDSTPVTANCHLEMPVGLYLVASMILALCAISLGFLGYIVSR